MFSTLIRFFLLLLSDISAVFSKRVESFGVVNIQRVGVALKRDYTTVNDQKMCSSYVMFDISGVLVIWCFFYLIWFKYFRYDVLLAVDLSECACFRQAPNPDSCPKTRSFLIQTENNILFLFSFI